MNRKILMSILIFGSFLSLLNQTLLNVALSSFMDVFHVSASQVQWLSTGFMLVNGIVIPFTAYLMKIFSTRQLFLTSMLLLLIGTIICSVAPTFIFVLIGRLIQAAGAGIIAPLMMNIIMHISTPETRGSAMGLVGVAMVIAPAIAPTIAGFILIHFSWRWLFIFILPFIIITILCALKYLENVSEREEAPFDYISILLSSLGFGLLLYGFSSAGSNGWTDSNVLITLFIGLAITLIFCIRQFKLDTPLLDLSTFKYKIFAISNVLNLILAMLMYSDMILLPIYVQDGRGFSAFDAGLILLPGALINALLSPFIGRAYDKYGPKILFLIGSILILPSMIFVIFADGETAYGLLMARTMLFRIGFSFLAMPINTAGLNALPQRLLTHGTAINNTVRQLAGSIGTGLIITVYTMRYNSSLNQIESSQNTTAAGHFQELATIYAFSHSYVIMTILAIIGLIIVIFYPKKTVVNVN